MYKLTTAEAVIRLSDGAVVSWVLADNSVIMATAAELLEALTLAGLEQSRLWGGEQ